MAVNVVGCLAAETACAAVYALRIAKGSFQGGAWVCRLALPYRPRVGKVGMYDRGRRFAWFRVWLPLRGCLAVCRFRLASWGSSQG